MDILVGTHRLLSRDVIPKNLGLVIARRGAALRRRPEGAAPLAAARGGRARALGHADPAHAPHVALRPPRHLRDRDSARGPACDPHAASASTTRSSSRRRSSASTRAEAQSFYLHNRVETIEEAALEAPAALPGAALRGRARADAGARARGQDALVPARRRRRPRLDHDHRVGTGHPPGEHARSSSAPTCSASPSSTRSAAASAARTCSRTPTSSIPTRGS